MGMEERKLMLQNLTDKKLLFVVLGCGVKKFIFVEKGQKYIVKAKQAKSNNEDIVVKVMRAED
mgnify:CR=1 FL=1